MKQLNVAIIGYSETAKLFAGLLNKLSKDSNSPLKLVAISGEVGDKSKYNGVMFNDSADAIAMAVNVDIVVICIEGVSQPHAIARDALEHGKHVITNNQTMMAVHGRKLWSLAADKGVHLRFEASLLGGVPVVDMLLSSLAGLEVNRIYGVLNSTCNYALMRMKDTGCKLKEAINDAVELGYAEKDPELDVSGKDSLYKLALLSTAAFGEWFDITKAKTESLNDVDPVDIGLAQQFGCNIKLLAEATAGKLTVAPTLMEELSQLGNTNGTLTGLVVESKASGPMFMAGHGSDKSAIASALLVDSMAIASGKRLAKLRKKSGEYESKKIKKYYLRLPQEGGEKIVKANHIQVIEEKTVSVTDGQYVAYIVETGMDINELKDFASGVKYIEKTCVMHVFGE